MVISQIPESESIVILIAGYNSEGRMLCVTVALIQDGVVRWSPYDPNVVTIKAMFLSEEYEPLCAAWTNHQ